MNRRRLALFLVASALVAAPAAGAATPAAQQYPGKAHVAGALKPPSNPSPPSSPSSGPSPSVAAKTAQLPTSSSHGLPFTGFAIGIPLLVGIALVAAGFGLRRVARHRTQ